jgi:hypothetical protein
LRYRVEVDRSHLASLTGSTLAGITELVWNAIDADADRIVIELTRNEAEGVTGYAVDDNGHGITPDVARQHFVRLGGSWKSHTARSPGERPLHGKLGQGRFKAFSQGGVGRWTSVADTDDGRVETIIRISSSDIDACDISDATPSSAPTGTRVEVQALAQPVTGVDGMAARDQLTAWLALPMAAYGLTIVYDGHALDLDEVQNRRDDYDLPGVSDRLGQPVKLSVIEWSVNARRSLFLCNADGIALHEINPGFRVRDFRFSGYVRWDGFAEQIGDLPTIEMQHGPAKDVLDAARERLLEHFEEVRGERRTRLVTKWRQEGVYPFEGPPANAVEEATRETFDLVALQASDVLDSGRIDSKKLSLRLLKEALERSPGAVHDVLQDVLSLDDEKVEELSTLLEKTPLARVISASTAITDRLEFLQGLAAMTTSPEWRKLVLERSQLHKVLEKETWIFGEEYALVASDKGLTTVLEQHLHHLHRDDDDGDADEPGTTSDTGETRDAEGRRRIVDLMFNGRIPQAENRRHHLVVELKRPAVHVGPTELEQIKNYALAVAKNPRFNTDSTRWQFWVISTEVHGTADEDRRQKDKPFGLAVEYENHNIQIWVKTWAEVLQAAEHRLRFVQDQLGYAPGDQEALRYLRRKHAETLPDEMGAQSVAGDGSETTSNVAAPPSTGTE